MKKPTLLLFVLLLMVGAAAFSGQGRSGKNPDSVDLHISVEERNPFTHLRVGAGVDFQFAIVSDRTGGHRTQIFSQAIKKLDLLQPEFVVSVGDLIEGSRKREVLQQEWKEFDGFVKKLSMPFFYVAGNHDVGNPDSDRFWAEKLGRRHYQFVYRDVLFLVLNSEDPPGSSALGDKQLAWARQVLTENAKARWTLVFVHKPLWVGDAKKANWLALEEALGDRPYTVFCGHVHRFQKFMRNGRNYYQLATTGGVSRMRGIEQGEFDHITWVTMKKDGPLLAHVMLDAVLPEDLRPVATDEPGVARELMPTHPARGQAHYKGTPIPGAVVVLHPLNAKSKAKRADGVVHADGTFALTTYKAGDGAVEGEYAVTATWRRSVGGKTVNLLPDRYASPATSGLRTTIRPGENRLMLELK